MTAHHGSGELEESIATDPDYLAMPVEMQRRLDVEGGAVAVRAWQIARGIRGLTIVVFCGTMNVMNRITPAETVVTAFGGVRPLARLLGCSPSSVSRWGRRVSVRHGKSMGTIPSTLHAPLLMLARERGVHLTATDLVLGRPTKK